MKDKWMYIAIPIVVILVIGGLVIYKVTKGNDNMNNVNVEISVRNYGTYYCR